MLPSCQDEPVTRPRLTDGTRTSRLSFAVDLLAITVFVVAGMRSHRTGSAIDVFARNAVPLGGAWIATAFLLGSYRPASLSRLLATWAIAVPTGVVLRSWWTGSPDGDELLVFGAVAMLFILAFLGAGRMLVGVIGSRTRTRSTP